MIIMREKCKYEIILIVRINHILAANITAKARSMLYSYLENFWFIDYIASWLYDYMELII